MLIVECCKRSTDQVVLDLVLWQAAHGKRSKVSPVKTPSNQLCDYSNLTYEDMCNSMLDRNIWKTITVRWKSLD